MINPSMQKLWRTLEDNVLQAGSFSVQGGSLPTITWLAHELNIETSAPDWSKQLLELLSLASHSQDVSMRIAAAGVARSFRVFGTWGLFLAETPQDKELCRQARNTSLLFLRTLSDNWFHKTIDRLAEWIASSLIERTILPAEYEGGFRRKMGMADRDKESGHETGFDAVVTFADAGIYGELCAIEQKRSAKIIKWWESLLQAIEKFLRDVFLTSHSSHDNVARLQVLWRLLTREIDAWASRPTLTAEETLRLQMYGWQFQSIRKMLTHHYHQGHWDWKEEDSPFIHIKKMIDKETLHEIHKKTWEHLVNSRVIDPMDLMIIYQLIETR